MARKAITTLYLTPEPFNKLKKLCQSMGKSTSEFVDELIIKEVASLSGEGEVAKDHVDYEALKRSYEKLIGELDRLEGKLKKKKVYDPLVSLAFELGLKQDLSNLNAISPKLLEAWVRQDATNLVESAHLFISLLELVQQKRAVEQKLNSIRGFDAHSVGSSAEASAGHSTSDVGETQAQEKASPLIEDEEGEEDEWEEDLMVEDE